MLFCKVCGQALNLFETHDEEVCYSCLKKTMRQEQPPAVQEEGGDDPLAGALLVHEEGKIVLRAAEGWVLWSAPDHGTYGLAAILTRARRICEIRKKRKK